MSADGGRVALSDDSRSLSHKATEVNCSLQRLEDTWRLRVCTDTYGIVNICKWVLAIWDVLFPATLRCTPAEFIGGCDWTLQMS